MNRYAKAIVQVLGTILAAIAPLLVGNGDIDPREWVNVAIIGVGAVAVYYGPNVAGAETTKAILSALAAALVVLHTVIIGGVDTAEWIQILLAALAAAGVYAKANEHNANARL